MQKKIIALAVAGLMSGAAFAQSNVQIYGIVDVGYSHHSSSDAAVKRASRTKMSDGQQSGSRIGFRGTEDLGNGLKASFVLESSISNDSQAGAGIWSGTNRQSFLALSGDFGTAAFGRQYTPQFVLMARMDPFGVGTVGDVGSIARGLWGITPRLNNLAAYVSPTWNGFNFVAGYSTGGLADEAVWNTGAKNPNAKVWAINPNYKNGPLDIGFNYHRAKVDAGNISLPTWELAASYNFGILKLSGAYGRDKVSVGGTTVTKTRKYFAGISAPVGTGSLLASYTNWKETESAPDLKASKWAVGYNYPMSKRTNVYAAYAKISQNDALEGTGRFSLDGVAANEYTSGLNIGLRHSF